MNILVENKNGCDIAEQLSIEDTARLLKAKKIYLVEGIIYRRTKTQDKPAKKPAKKPSEKYKTKVIKPEA